MTGETVQPAPRLARSTREATAIRERILDICRRLFNEEGFSNITTKRIAEALEMNEGHLHYYFNTKAQIVTALFDMFERLVMAAASRGLDAPDRLDRYADYQQNWFVLMWRCRFFYRDHRSLLRVAPKLELRLAKLCELCCRQLRLVLDDMVSLGLIEATNEELEALTINTWIVSTHWIDYVATLRGNNRLTPADLEGGIRQIDSLFSRYMTPHGVIQRARRRDPGDIPAEILEYAEAAKPQAT